MANLGQNTRPDPDALLAAIRYEENKKVQAKLRIFFGMAAGVGKTYAMLKVAHEKIKEGQGVVIGIIETHKRSETLALVQGIPSIPLTKVEYRGTLMEEMDLAAIIKRKPQIVLVDELAHTNVPGSLHPKRWQDVLDLLNAGINVYTTVNVQHIEGLKDSIEHITGIPIRETVPDSILERADQIELIDLSPSELLKRLGEGKVYIGDKAQLAAENFFKVDKLMALREISLRFTADKVDHELRRIMASKQGENQWKGNDLLLMVFNDQPSSERIIRATRRMAFNLECPWIAAYSDLDIISDVEKQNRISKNIKLSRELGAEIMTLSDLDLIQAINRIVRQKGVTKLVCERPIKRELWDYLPKNNFLLKLMKELPEIDFYILKQEQQKEKKFSLWPKKHVDSSMKNYLLTFLLILLVSSLCKLVSPILGYKNIGLIFLLTVTLIGYFASLGPIIFAAFLSCFIWNYFFIPPFYHLLHKGPDDMAMQITYFFISLITGTLTNRIVVRDQILLLREQRTEAMYDIVREIASASNKQNCIDNVIQRIAQLLRGECAVALKDEINQLVHYAKGSEWWFNRPKEWAVSLWVFNNKKSAGRGTDNLPLSEALYLPLQGAEETIGVLAFRPISRGPLGREEENLLFTVTRQLATYLEKELFYERSEINRKNEEVKKLHHQLVHMISTEVKGPLTNVTSHMAKQISELLKQMEKLQLEKLEKKEVNLDQSKREFHHSLKEIEHLKKVLDHMEDQDKVS